MIKIKLTKNEYALVDDEDADWLNRDKWHAQKMGENCYARRNSGKIHMHREIMKAPNDKLVDHIDGNGLNNQKNNLRLCSHAENIRNQKVRCNNTSGIKGICWAIRDKKWRCYIMLNGKQISLGYHSDIQIASKIVKEAYKKYHKEYARL